MKPGQLRALAVDVVRMQGGCSTVFAGRTTAEVIASSLGMHAHYASEEWKAARRGDEGQQGLAILSRAPLRGKATLSLPGSRIARYPQAAAVGARVDRWWSDLGPHDELPLRRFMLRAKQQVSVIDEWAIRGFGRDNMSAPQILCGDFNATLTPTRFDSCAV